MAKYLGASCIDAHYEHRTARRKRLQALAPARRAVDNPAECLRNAVDIVGKSLWKSREQDVDDDVNIYLRWE
jgi:hypothetical protein